MREGHTCTHRHTQERKMILRQFFVNLSPVTMPVTVISIQASAILPPGLGQSLPGPHPWLLPCRYSQWTARPGASLRPELDSRAKPQQNKLQDRALALPLCTLFLAPCLLSHQSPLSPAFTLHELSTCLRALSSQQTLAAATQSFLS